LKPPTKAVCAWSGSGDKTKPVAKRIAVIVFMIFPKRETFPGTKERDSTRPNQRHPSRAIWRVLEQSALGRKISGFLVSPVAKATQIVSFYWFYIFAMSGCPQRSDCRHSPEFAKIFRITV
jgi:hypothetical protein